MYAYRFQIGSDGPFTGSQCGVAQHPTYSVQDTEVGTLLDDPAAAAILEKHMPGFTTNDKISAARGFTLASLQAFVPSITDKILADIDKDLKNLPPKHNEEN